MIIPKLFPCNKCFDSFRPAANTGNRLPNYPDHNSRVPGSVCRQGQSLFVLLLFSLNLIQSINFSPAATACERVACPVIPVAPNIATFSMESDIVPHWLQSNFDLTRKQQPSARSASDAGDTLIHKDSDPAQKRLSDKSQRGASAELTPPRRV